jgi:hypothetical protein
LEDYITTHYPDTGGGDPDETWKNREKDGLPCDETERPSCNNYFNHVTAAKAVTFNEIQVFQQEVYEKTARHVDILNYDPNTNILAYLSSDVSNIQIINNIPHGTSLFTVVLPPHWHRSPPTRYPVLLRAMGYLADNNAIYTTRTAFQRVKWVANSVNIGPGLIAIFSNAGGRESQGVHSNAYDDVGSFLDLLTAFPVGGGQNETVDLGPDLSKIVANGGSRGGSTALAWGANPAGYNYEVLGIHADVPPLKLGSMMRRSFYAFPGLNSAANEALGCNHAYLYAYTDCQTGQILTPDQKALAVGNVFVGGVDFGGPVQKEIESIDNLSACGICANSKSSLKSKRVTISLGTHDAYTSMADFLDFDNMLNDNPHAVPHKTYIGHMWGHGYVDRLGACDAYGCYPDSYVSAFRLLKGQGLPPYPDSKRIFEIPDCQRDPSGQCMEPIAVNWERLRRITPEFINHVRAIHSQDALKDYFPPTHDPSKLGFSATVPAKVVRHNPHTIVLMGQAGKPWEIYARSEVGYHPLYRASGTFGNPTGRDEEVEWGSEWVVMQYEIGAAVGRYEWFFKYDGKEIPNRFTPWVSNGTFAKTVTDVLPEELGSNDYWHDHRQNQLINFGVDQYHVLLLAKNQDPIIDYIPNKYVTVGQTLGFSITATDPDGDELVYDVRNRAGNLYDPTVGLNGKTGWFKYQPKPHHVGTHRVTAIAKDGKGGRGERYFYVRVLP